MRVFIGLVAVLFIACYCNGCRREDGALSEGLCWEVRRVAGMGKRWVLNEMERRAGVGKLVEVGIELGRSVNHKLKIGICGEHGGEPSSIDFCHRVNMNHVSCSPFRVPIARLAAAQAAIRNR